MNSKQDRDIHDPNSNLLDGDLEIIKNECLKKLKEKLKNPHHYTFWFNIWDDDTHKIECKCAEIVDESKVKIHISGYYNNQFYYKIEIDKLIKGTS